MLWRFIKLFLLAVLGFIALTAVYAKASNAWFVVPLAGLTGIWLYRRSTSLQVAPFVPAQSAATAPTPAAPVAVSPEEVTDQMWREDEQLMRFGFTSRIEVAGDDAHIAQLHREATQHALAKDWDRSISTLQAAYEEMQDSPYRYSIEQWVRLPLYLQKAGRFEESMQVFQELLDDTPSRNRREWGCSDGRPRSEAEKLIRRHTASDRAFIRKKQALAQHREQKRLGMAKTAPK